MEELGELPNRNRIFALTGNAREGQVESARAAGMDEVFVRVSLCRELIVNLSNPIPRSSLTNSKNSWPAFEGSINAIHNSFLYIGGLVSCFSLR